MAQELKETSLFSDASLLAYYRFNSGALTTDSKGSYTLTNNNSVGETANGKFGYAADLGSSNTNKSFSRNDACGLGGNKTASMWIKLNTEISSGTYNLLWSYNKTDGRELGIKYEYNGGTRRLTFIFSKVDVAVVEINYNITLGTSDWYHLAITTDNNNCIAYVNGVQVGIIASSGNGGTGYNAVFGIGCLINVISYAQSNFASVIIDDVALFSRVLTDIEISTLYSVEIKKIAGVTRDTIKYLSKVPNIADEFHKSSLLTDANLLAYYRLEDGAMTTDSSGNGKTLTVSGSVPTTTGKFGYGADFSNNSTNGLGGINGLILNQSALTVSLWVKPKANNSIRFLIQQGNTDETNGCIKIYFNGADISFGIKNLDGSNGRFGANVSVTVGFPVNNWIHLVGTYDGTNMRLYYNGSQVGTVATSGNAGANEEFKIGRLSSGWYAANDVIDDVIVFNRALTANEIKSIYGSQIKKFMGVSNI